MVSPVDPRDTDLNHFHVAARLDPTLSTGHFKKVKLMTDCCNGLGKVELHQWEGADAVHNKGTLMVVKRIATARALA